MLYLIKIKRGKQMTEQQDKIKILDKMEDEALEMFDNFKQHPIKSLVVGIIVLFLIRKIYEIVRGK